MKAVRFHKTGGPDVLTCEDVADPTPRDGEVLIPATLDEIMDFIMSGKLSPQIGLVLPLSQAAEAHRLLESRKTTGKVVLQPWVEA